MGGANTWQEEGVWPQMGSFFLRAFDPWKTTVAKSWGSAVWYAKWKDEPSRGCWGSGDDLFLSQWQAVTTPPVLAKHQLFPPVCAKATASCCYDNWIPNQHSSILPPGGGWGLRGKKRGGMAGGEAYLKFRSWRRGQLSETSAGLKQTFFLKPEL